MHGRRGREAWSPRLCSGNSRSLAHNHPGWLASPAESSRYRPPACNAYLLSHAAVEASRRCTRSRPAHSDLTAMFPTWAEGGSARALAASEETLPLKNQPLRAFPSQASGQERYTSVCLVARAVPHPVVRSDRNTSGFQWVSRVGQVLVVTTEAPCWAQGRRQTKQIIAVSAWSLLDVMSDKQIQAGCKVRI